VVAPSRFQNAGRKASARGRGSATVAGVDYFRTLGLKECWVGTFCFFESRHGVIRLHRKSHRSDTYLLPLLFFHLSQKRALGKVGRDFRNGVSGRSEEHTSELQSRFDLVCRLL